MTFINYYKILQVDPSAEEDIIVVAFKKLAIKYHPDLNKSENATRRMQELNEAYFILSDPQKRAAYDQEYSAHFDFEEPRTKNHEDSENDVKTSQSNEDWGLLIHQSDFSYSSNRWGEKNDIDYQTFRKDGYYCIKLLRTPYERYQYPIIPVANFRSMVSATFSSQSNLESECGIVFRISQNLNGDDYYRFGISKGGYYSLYIHQNNKYFSIKDHSPSRYIHSNAVNQLMVKMEAGGIISIGVNGQILALVKDNRISMGNVGLFAATHSSITEVQFKDFRLYSL